MTSAAEATWFESPTGPVRRSTQDTGEVSFIEAIRAALSDLLEENEKILLLGEDIGRMGGAFRATQGLFERFGPKRVIDTPMAESVLIGASIGLAISGMRPIAELQFADFISCAYDQLVTEAAKLHYRFQIPVPLVVRAPSGAGVGAGPFHSQSPEGIFARVPGLKVVCPGTVQDAYDLLIWAASDPNPVLYFEHKALYRSIKGSLKRGCVVQLDESPRPIVRRRGDDLTVVTYGSMLRACTASAKVLSDEGIGVEIIDLRILAPLSIDEILASVAKTSRLLIVHEDATTAGIGNEIAARVAEQAIWGLDAPIIRVTPPDVPIPFSEGLEQAYLPSVEQVSSAMRNAASS